MIRLFLKSEFVSQQKIELEGKQVHYLTHVMRLKSGDKIEIFNGQQGVWLADIQSEKKKVFVKCLKQSQKQQNLKPCILCFALIKKEPMDWIFQKATELGVTEIYPLMSERTVVKQLNMERAKSILIEACEQCERTDIPTLHTPQKLLQLLDELKGRADLIWLSERGQTHKSDSSLTPALFVGPEGGWTDKESELFKKYQAQEWHLGHTILRAETACLAGITLCLNKNE